MRVRTFCLSFLASSSAFCTQVPLFSSYRLAPQIYNPAYVGYDNKYSLSFIGGLGGTFYISDESFNVKDRTINKDKYISGLFYKANFLNFNAAAPFTLKNGDQIAVGVSYMNNDLHKVESVNSFIFSLSYSAKLSNGKLGIGVNIKRNTMLATAYRIYSNYDPGTNQIIFDDYKEMKVNADIGVLYTNNKNTFDIGFSIWNISKQFLGINSLNGQYQFYYNSVPQIIGTTGFQVSFSDRLKLKNSILIATNTNGNYTNYLVRSLLYYGSFGVGVQTTDRALPTIGPSLSFNNKLCEITYTYKTGILKRDHAPDFHEIGVKFIITQLKKP